MQVGEAQLGEKCSLGKPQWRSSLPKVPPNEPIKIFRRHVDQRKGDAPLVLTHKIVQLVKMPGAHMF